MRARARCIGVAATLTAVLSLAACGGSSTSASGTRTFTFDFAQTTQQWTAGFADYPPAYEPDMELIAGYRPLPPPLDTTRGGFFISGFNRSDDLFMFLARRVDGLRSGRTYAVEITVEFATNVPKGVGGAGGSPDTSVFVKAGASSTEPMVVMGPVGSCPSSDRCVTIDKGNQAQDGREAVGIGTAGNLSGTNRWELKELRSAAGALSVVPSASGSVWLLVGTDSGFEGRTSLYYTRISATLTPR
jgi:hypothetical protein